MTANQEEEIAGQGEKVFVWHWLGGDLEGHIVKGMPIQTNAYGTILFDTDAPFTMVDDDDGRKYRVTDPWNCTVEDVPGAPPAPH